LERRFLGNTGIEVSRMCMGTLTMGPLQARLSPEEGAELIVQAYERGVTFFDTADLYGTYEHLALALRRIPRERVVIASRCYEYTYRGMKAAIHRALEALGTDYIDIFGLHEQETALTLSGHEDALLCAADAKRAGTIRAVSVSTHAIEVVEALGDRHGVDVVHPIFNMRGIGIIDGHVEQMAEAIRKVRARGVGVYSMKPLGGGHLLKQALQAIAWVLSNECVDSMAIGVRDLRELEIDVALVEGRPVDEGALQRIACDKRLFIEGWCLRCGRCVKACHQGALRLGPSGLEVDHSRCVLCGYCVAQCRDFCIKVL
jgi:aryl-alcohol dehydrogenase-like predicted oxidoreductase